jgi:hypothetical protein
MLNCDNEINFPAEIFRPNAMKRRKNVESFFKQPLQQAAKEFGLFLRDTATAKKHFLELPIYRNLKTSRSLLIVLAANFNLLCRSFSRISEHSC